MKNILILGKPGSGKTTYLSNLYGVYNEKHHFNKRNPKQLDEFSIIFESDDAFSLKQNYRLLRANKEIKATTAFQEFDCLLRENKEDVMKFRFCDNRGGITHQMQWGNHLEWISKLIELIENDTNGGTHHNFDAVMFFYDCSEFKDDDDIYVERDKIRAQLRTLSSVAQEANKPVFLVFTKRDTINRNDMNEIDEIFTEALGYEGYLNKIFLHLTDISTQNRGKIVTPAIYLLRKLYMNDEGYDEERAERLRQFCMHISNL